MLHLVMDEIQIVKIFKYIPWKYRVLFTVWDSVGAILFRCDTQDSQIATLTSFSFLRPWAITILSFAKLSSKMSIFDIKWGISFVPWASVGLPFFVFTNFNSQILTLKHKLNSIYWKTHCLFKLIYLLNILNCPSLQLMAKGKPYFMKSGNNLPFICIDLAIFILLCWLIIISVSN